jgi:hypothetical protein
MSKLIVVTDQGTRYHRNAKILSLDPSEYQLLTSGNIGLSQVYPLEEFTLADLQGAVNRYEDEEDNLTEEDEGHRSDCSDTSFKAVVGEFYFQTTAMRGGVLIQVLYAKDDSMAMTTFLPNRKDEGQR